VLDTLGGLVEQFMILAEYGEEGDGIRYRMLEPIRQYAREKLQERGEAEQARRLHARYYLDLAEQAEPRMKCHSQVEWLDKLEAENDKLRTAIGGSLKARDAQTAARFGWADGEEGFGLAPRILVPAVDTTLKKPSLPSRSTTMETELSSTPSTRSSPEDQSAGLGSSARWAFAISTPASASSKACPPLLTATIA
jgi:hypothetical protein